MRQDWRDFCDDLKQTFNPQPTTHTNMTPYQSLIQEAFRNDTEKHWDAVVSEFNKRISTAKAIYAYLSEEGISSLKSPAAHLFFEELNRKLSREAAMAIALMSHQSAITTN